MPSAWGEGSTAGAGPHGAKGLPDSREQAGKCGLSCPGNVAAWVQGIIMKKPHANEVNCN